MNENWNFNDWQGKRRDQVESSYKIAGFSLLILSVIVISLLLQ